MHGHTKPTCKLLAQVDVVYNLTYFTTGLTCPASSGSLSQELLHV